MTSRSFRAFQVDTFTARLFTGNPASVVLDADSLSDAEMHAITRELGRGDAAFVQSARGSDHDLYVRFFTPVREAPFIGHATLAVHVVRSQLASGATQRLRQRSAAGDFEIDVEQRDGATHVGVRQAAPTRVRALEHAEVEALLDALGLGRADLDPRCPVEIYGQRSTRLVLAVRSHGALTHLKPDFAALGRLTSHVGAEGFFVFTLESGIPGFLTEARMFCPAIGIPEDAVSGNAHGMLGTYLVRHALLRADNGVARFRGTQGAVLGRPGEVDIEVWVDKGAPSTVRIAGTGVVVFSTTLTL